MRMISFFFFMYTLSVLNQDKVLPASLLGNFIDDYEIKYSVTNNVWIQYPDFEMNITMIDTSEMFMLGYDTEDSTYTRIDYMPFDHMGDYTWGFCYTAYDKKDEAETLSIDSADRETPKTGCNGFPFSRMRRIVE